MKTIKEWLQELPEPYRTKALANTPEKNLSEKTTHLDKALSLAFIWRRTKEGATYWQDVSFNIYLPRLPKSALQAIKEISSKKAISPNDITDIWRAQDTDGAVVSGKWFYQTEERSMAFVIDLNPE